MSELQDLLAAPLVYKLGDRTYTISPLTLNDWAAYARFVQFHDYMSIKDDPLIPPEIKVITMQRCIERTISLHSYELIESFDTTWGMIEFCFLSLSKKHPDITREMLYGFDMTHISSMSILATTISQLEPTADPDDKEEVKKVEAWKKKVTMLVALLKTQGILL